MSDGTRRTAEEWVRDLTADGTVHDAAVTDLRRILVRGLTKSLGPRGLDESFIEDAVQDALLKILDRIEQFGFRSKFTTWAMTIASREAITERRRSRWKDVSLDEVSGGGRFEPESVNTAGQAGRGLERDELVATLKRVVDARLTEKQRVAINAELAGMPQEEIARRTGSNRNAIYKLVHDARKKLKTGLEEAGYTNSDILAIMG